MKTSIPDDLIEKLRDARSDDDKTEFYSLILGIKQAGYTYSEISEPLEVSRSAANQWVRAAERLQITPTPAPKKEEPVKDPTGIPRKIIPDVPRAQREHIRTTADLAKTNSRWSREDSPERKASHELQRLIELHVVQRKVPAATFARHAGVTRHAIVQRVDRLNRERAGTTQTTNSLVE